MAEEQRGDKLEEVVEEEEEEDAEEDINTPENDVECDEVEENYDANDEGYDANNDNLDNYDEDDDDDNNDDAVLPYSLFFQQLIEAQKKDIQKRKQERFAPLMKLYLKASFAKKDKMLRDSPQIIRHFVFLCRNVIEGKIPSSITGADKALMRFIADKHTPKEDVRLYLLEDFRQHHYCSEALSVCENGRRREKTDVDGRGEVQQHDGEDRTTCEPTQNTGRRKKNTNRSGTNR
jgi:hypothetical protein